ncbi:MAG: hypothetical protein ACRDLS_15115 [Solirubrobacteraceae bacterium]
MLSTFRPPAVSEPRQAARLALAGLVALLLMLVLAGTANAARPVVFGIYPGGAAGTVGADNATRPEVPALRRQALLRLRRPGRPFVVRIYNEYRGPSDADVLPPWLASQIAAYTLDGFKVELVLPYRPSSPVGDVAGYVNFVRARVRQLGPNPNVTDLQVTNEANVNNAPNAADGAYPGAHDALVYGVMAAKAESRAGGFGQLRVGFSWADQSGPAERAFFATLGAKGGAAFANSVDWVGVDAYPGTWGPALPSGKLVAAVRKATVRTMRRLRVKLMPAAGLRAARIHFSEAGYPTGPRRTTAMQKAVMRSAVRTVSKYRAKYGVTDFRWFDLRDANSSSPSFESQYGLMKDDYTPKPAFYTFRKLVSRQR